MPEQVGNKARSLISIPKFGAYLLGATNCGGKFCPKRPLEDRVINELFKFAA